jgi:hypothetical protein
MRDDNRTYWVLHPWVPTPRDLTSISLGLPVPPLLVSLVLANVKPMN